VSKKWKRKAKKWKRAAEAYFAGKEHLIAKYNECFLETQRLQRYINVLNKLIGDQTSKEADNEIQRPRNT